VRIRATPLALGVGFARNLRRVAIGGDDTLTAWLAAGWSSGGRIKVTRRRQVETGPQGAHSASAMRP
jgi:hypothetical protein